MSKRPWIFQSNPFETHTRNSNRKMFTISTDTHSKLQAESADADILAMFNNLDPVFQAYVLIYANYSVVFGERKGKTLNLVTQLQQLGAIHLPKWEVMVHTLYPKGTAEEVEIFPNGRAPFMNGTYEERIGKVQALHMKVAANPALATLTPLVLSFYNLLITARDTQQQKEGLKGQLSASRESQRVLLANELYKVLGGMMVKFYDNRAQISHYFDLALLRTKSEDEETVLDTKQGIVAAGSTVNIGTPPAGTTKVSMKVLAGGPLEFGMSIDGLNFNGNTITLSAPGETMELLTYFASTGTLFIVRNQNGTVQGEYKVEFIG